MLQSLFENITVSYFISLQHALLVRGIKGIEPTHITPRGENIVSIPYYNEELEKLNNRILETTSKIEAAKEEERMNYNSLKGVNHQDEVVADESAPSSPSNGIKAAEELKKYISNMKHVGIKSVQLATELVRGSEDGKVRKLRYAEYLTCAVVFHTSIYS